MHINLAYLLLALLSVARAAPTPPSEENNLKQHSASGRPDLFHNQVYVKLSYYNAHQKTYPMLRDDHKPKLKKIFEEWIRNTKLIKMEKDEIRERKPRTAIEDLPDILLVPLEIVIESGSAPVLEEIEFWGPGVKDIPGIEEGCETKANQCRASVFREVVFFYQEPPWKDMYYVHVRNGSGVGIKEYHTNRVAHSM